MERLQQQFKEYITRNHLLVPGSKVLAAVSGGIDSMVMLHLLCHSGIDCAVAHCNFSLRDKESDRDALFVTQTAATYKIPLHTIRFDTNGYASGKGISTQMAARDLRYQWFDDLIKEHEYDGIAIAHNRDDGIETLFINLARGTGIRGLTGIKPRNEHIIRPLLFASRAEITAYATAHGIDFREDSSNASDKYARNYIRHHLIPGLQQYFPGLQQTVVRDMAHFAGVEAFYHEAIGRFKEQIVNIKDHLVYIDLTRLMQSPSPSTLLYEIIRDFGYSFATVSDILNKIVAGSSGQQFLSHSHRIIHNRQKLIVQVSDGCVLDEYIISEDTACLETPVKMDITRFAMYPEFKLNAGRNIAYLDAAKICYPLVLRKWQHGDMFYPLGMKQKKKLSDFFIDHKLSVIEKEQVWVITSEGQIVWIVAQRIDDRFKVTADTKEIVAVEIGRI